MRTLSGGNQQKVALGRLLHQEASVWLLDEPTRGVDVGSKVQLYEAIAAAADAGCAVVIVSSYLPELFGLCDSLAVMSRGRLTASAPLVAVDAGVGHGGGDWNGTMNAERRTLNADCRTPIEPGRYRIDTLSDVHRRAAFGILRVEPDVRELASVCPPSPLSSAWCSSSPSSR